MGADRATRAVLRDLAKEAALTQGHEDIEVVRAAYDRVFCAWTAVSIKPTCEYWTQLNFSQYMINMLTVEPADTVASPATIIFLHGGGWSLGSAVCYAPLARFLAAESGMRVVVPDFPQAPEDPFPAALGVLAELTQRMAHKFEGRVLLAGDSAGGTLAAVLSGDSNLRDYVAGLALFYPVLDLRADAKYKSRRRFGAGKLFLTEAGILGAAAMYCGENGDAASPRLSPILERSLESMPPSFMLIPDLDPLRDECERYVGRLKKSGVRVDLFRAKDTIHGCASFSGRILQGREGLKACARFFKSCGVNK